MPELQDWNTIKQAAQYLQRTPQTVWRWICNGTLPASRPRGSRSWLISREEIEKALQPEVKP